MGKPIASSIKEKSGKIRIYIILEYGILIGRKYRKLSKTLNESHIYLKFLLLYLNQSYILTITFTKK